MKKVVCYVSIVVLLIGCGFAAGFFIGKSAANTEFAQVNRKVVAVRGGGYKFINPLLDYEQSENTFAELTSFKDDIQKYVNMVESQNKASLVSVYFRDLNNGPWYGVNETASFTPASLLKLPVMMAYYQEAANDPTVLSQRITVSTSTVSDIPQVIEPQHQLQPGQSYTVEQLIEAMVEESDNTAAKILIDHVPLDILEQVYKQFSIPIPTASNPNVTVTARNYGSLLRVLFNGSYLTKEYSEKALSILGQAEFKDGLVAGVPGNIMVSHKFGEYDGDNNFEELHDCGIVYYPNHPYVLCVMTQGSDLKKLTDVIEGVSGLVYSQIDDQIGQ